MVITYFAFGAILALINAFEFAVDRAVKSRVFGENGSLQVVGAYAVVFLVALGIVNAWLHPFHRVRLCDGGDCASAMSPDQRPDWLTRRRLGICKRRPPTRAKALCRW